MLIKLKENTLKLNYFKLYINKHKMYLHMMSGIPFYLTRKLCFFTLINLQILVIKENEKVNVNA